MFFSGKPYCLAHSRPFPASPVTAPANHTFFAPGSSGAMLWRLNPPRPHSATPSLPSRADWARTCALRPTSAGKANAEVFRKERRGRVWEFITKGEPLRSSQLRDKRGIPRRHADVFRRRRSERDGRGL